MATNSSSSDRPVMISGITSGAVVSAPSRPRPRKRPKRASAKPAMRAQDHRAGGVHDGDLQRQPRRIHDLAVLEQLPVPLERRRVHRIPHRHQARGIERVDDHATGSARTGTQIRRRASSATAACAGRSSSGLELAAAIALERSRSAPSSRIRMHDRDGACDRPVAVLEELIGQHAADHELIGRTQQRWE